MPGKVLAAFSAFLLTLFAAHPYSAGSNATTGINEKKLNDTHKKKKQKIMKIEIWSDVMCPFCYIGKRNFEAALAQFPDREHIDVEWKSFQLDPSIPDVPQHRQNVYQFVADRKGVSYEQSVRMHEQVVKMAKDAGLDYHFDKVRVTNSLKAHRLIQFAKTKGLGEQAEERLFFAYFTEGKNLSVDSVLTALGNDIGLTNAEAREALTDPVFLHKAQADAVEASKLGITGVPFFVIDRKYGISGAQPVAEMLGALQAAYAAWQQSNPGTLQVVEGKTCAPDGGCAD